MKLAQYIEQDLATRLASQADGPATMTLAGLARHYGVSITPVREAVAALVSAGVLEKGSNRRLQLGPRARSRANNLQEDTASTRADEHIPESTQEIAKRIRDELVQMSLAQEAVFLREEATARRFNLSRSALRNIFHELSGLGLLEHVPRRGWRLRPFRQSDMQAFLEVREVLELKALELARQRLDSKRLTALLEGNVVPSSSKETPRIDNSLHAYFIECAGNPYIQDFFDRHSPYYDLLFDWEDSDRDVAAETARQHRAILEALLNKQWSQAQRELARHIRDNHPVLSKSR